MPGQKPPPEGPPGPRKPCSCLGYCCEGISRLISSCFYVLCCCCICDSCCGSRDPHGGFSAPNGGPHGGGHGGCRHRR